MAGSYLSEALIRPIGGWTEAQDVSARPESIVSGQNIWVRRGSLEPRYKLSHASFNPIISGSSLSNEFSQNPQWVSQATRPLGTMTYFELTNGSLYPVVANYTLPLNQNSLYYTDGTVPFSWSRLSSVPANGITLNLSTDTRFTPRGAVVYSASTNRNLLVFTTGTSLASQGLGCWAGPIGNPATYSSLSNSPDGVDVCVFDNRPVVWAATGIPQRAKWPVAGDPYDWTGIGSGNEDLVDMIGAGTRIFATEDQMVLCSGLEMWRGRKVGPPYVFAFSPIHRQIGIPYGRAAIQTPLGIIWLGHDYNVYLMDGEQIRPIGDAIQRQLMDTLVGPDVAFFSFHPTLYQLRLFYTTTGTEYPQHSFTYHFKEGVWSAEVYAHKFICALSMPAPSIVGTESLPMPV